jgi:hypothetical protein
MLLAPIDSATLLIGEWSEWFVAVESELIIHSFSLLFNLVSVENSPSLILLSMFSPYNNSSSFFILASMNIKNLIILHVDEQLLLLIILEELEPSRVGAPDLHVVGLSGVLDVP